MIQNNPKIAKLKKYDNKINDELPIGTKVELIISSDARKESIAVRNQFP